MSQTEKVKVLDEVAILLKEGLTDRFINNLPAGIYVTVGKNIAWPENINVSSLESVISDIRYNKSLKEKITTIRTLFKQGKFEQAKQLKQKLPHFEMALFNGKRNSQNLRYIIGLVLDLDHIKSHPEDFLNNAIQKLTDLYFGFQSPTDGIKLVWVLDKPIIVTEENHTQAISDYKYLYDYMAELVSTTLGEKVDTQCKDPGRACFMSHSLFAVRRNVRLDVEAILRERGKFLTQKAPETQGEKRAEGLPNSALASGNSELATPDTRVVRGVLSIDEDFERAREVVCKLARIQFDYRDFVKVGLALRAGFGDRGKELWDMFLDNPHYSDTQATLDKHWRSFAQVHSTKLATLYYVGGKYGCA